MKRVISVLVSFLILATLYTQVDFSRLTVLFGNMNLPWLFLVFLFMFLILGLITIRFLLLIPPSYRPGYFQAYRQVLMGFSLNMILPSKMGDIMKGYFLYREKNLRKPLALAIVVFEKIMDLIFLIALVFFGLLFYFPASLLLRMCLWGSGLIFFSGLIFLFHPLPSTIIFNLGRRIRHPAFVQRWEKLLTAWQEVQALYHGRYAGIMLIVALSFLISFCFFLQLYFFIQLLHLPVSFRQAFGLTPLSLVAGLLPFTFAGIGTRDAALIYFFNGILSWEAASALGLLATARYIFPAIAGLPFFFFQQKRK